MAHETTHEATTEHKNGNANGAAVAALEARTNAFSEKCAEIGLKQSIAYTDKSVQQVEARMTERLHEAQAFAAGVAAKAVADVEKKIQDAEARAEEAQKLTLKSGGQLALKTTIVVCVAAGLISGGFGIYKSVMWAWSPAT